MANKAVVVCRARNLMANIFAADRKYLGLLQVEFRSPPSKTGAIMLEIDGVRSLESYFDPSSTQRGT